MATTRYCKVNFVIGEETGCVLHRLRRESDNEKEGILSFSGDFGDDSNESTVIGHIAFLMDLAADAASRCGIHLATTVTPLDEKSRTLETAIAALSSCNNVIAAVEGQRPIINALCTVACVRPKLIILFCHEKPQSATTGRAGSFRESP